VQLSEFDKSRIRYHLGYFTVSVPAGDYARLEEAMNTVPDSYFYNKISIQIRFESIAGDVDRTISSSNAKEALKVWDEIYLYETGRLAQILYVPNYKDPVQARYRFDRSGAEFIQALPGPADVAVGTRLYLNLTWR
jgi:hypothetical protein